MRNRVVYTRDSSGVEKTPYPPFCRGRGRIRENDLYILLLRRRIFGQISRQSGAEVFLVLMAREMARLGATAADERFNNHVRVYVNVCVCVYLRSICCSHL